MVHYVITDLEQKIGWIASITSSEFLQPFINVFRALSETHKNVVFKIVGGNFKTTNLDNFVVKDWSLAEKKNDLSSFDIGIMPMPDNAWTTGKCGFKAILYMSMGMPVVCSSVSINMEIIQGGINGFLANSEKEWIEKLSLLITNPNFRQRMGQNGRVTVEQKYSVKVNAPKFIEILEKVYYERIK